MMDTDAIISAIEDRFSKEGWTNLLIEKKPSEDGDRDEVFWVGVHDVTRIVDDKEVHPAIVVRVDGIERLKNLGRIELLWMMRIDHAARTMKTMIARASN